MALDVALDVGARSCLLYTYPIKLDVLLERFPSYYLKKQEIIIENKGIINFGFDIEMLKKQIKLSLPMGSQEMMIAIGYSFFYKIKYGLVSEEYNIVEINNIIITKNFQL